MTASKMKKEAERELYKAALEYHAVALDNIMKGTAAAMQLQGKLLGMRRMARVLELVDTDKAIEIENKAKADAKNGVDPYGGDEDEEEEDDDDD